MEIFFIRIYARSLLPSWGRRCVLTIPGGGPLQHPWVEAASPYLRSVTGYAIWYMGALLLCRDPV